MEGLEGISCSPNVIMMIKLRRMGVARHVGRMGQNVNFYWLLLGTHEMRRMAEKPLRILVNYINGDLKGTGWEYMEWI